MIKMLDDILSQISGNAAHNEGFSKRNSEQVAYTYLKLGGGMKTDLKFMNIEIGLEPFKFNSEVHDSFKSAWEGKYIYVLNFENEEGDKFKYVRPANNRLVLDCVEVLKTIPEDEVVYSDQEFLYYDQINKYRIVSVLNGTLVTIGKEKGDYGTYYLS